MMGICRFLLAKKEEVSLFDNGLRIESNLKILTNDNWQSRYVVCQRRCLSEAPLIGIFKNQRTREQNQHLELFYLQNYIGYEYGFKFKNSNKTLAILVQGQTLIFSFNNVESLVFWKEWLKDVCGRSALFFVRIYSAPKDNSIIKLTSRNARIHITRYALVIVQEIPPKQCLYLNLEDLSDVECVQNKFAFRALAYPWNHPQTFIFTSDQIPELTAKLQCLLKAKQYFNQQSNQVSRLSSLKNSSLGQTSTTQHPLQFFAAPSSIMYANDRGQQSPNTPMFTSMYANDNDGQRRSSDGSFEGDGPPPLKKKSFEEGPYAIPIELGGEPDDMDFGEEMQLHPVIRSRGGSRDHMRLEDFHFVSEGTPAQFLNQQLTTEQRNFAGMDAPPPGLVKPAAEMSFLSVGTKLRKSLSKKLKRHLAGSYSKYDGDKSSTSYPREQHAQNNSGSGCGGSQRKVRPRRSATPQSTSTTKLLANQPIMEDVPPPHQFPSRQPKMMTKQKATRNESFDSSISSTVRIDCAVQKGRERLKMSDRRSSTSASQRNSAVNSEKSSTNDLTVIENEGGENEEEEDEKEVKKGEVVDNEQDDDQALNAEAKSMSHSVSTLQTSGTRQSQSSTIGEAGFDRSHYSGGSEAITALGLDTPMAVSLEELMDPDFKIKGPSAISLREKSPSLDSGERRSSGGSQRSLSVCSELNSRILFQRGGRNRASGRSNKVATQITEVPLPPSLPPPLPPRKISSQHSMPKSLQLFKPNDDYADIDDVMFTANNDFNPIYSNEQQPPPNLPKISVMNNVDYVQICPIATTALKELSHQRGLAFKRSNSLYDILSLQPKNQQQQRKQQSSEAEYYCSIDWSSAAAQPRAFTSSTSYLTHVMSQTRKNLQKRGSASSSTNSLRILK